MVQEYAKKVVEKLGKIEFKASDGWLASFRKRHEIVFNELCGESSDVNSETVEEGVAKLPSIIEGYEPEYIANGDETHSGGIPLAFKRLCSAARVKHVSPSVVSSSSYYHQQGVPGGRMMAEMGKGLEGSARHSTFGRTD
jgi:hypothetical protein